MEGGQRRINPAEGATVLVQTDGPVATAADHDRPLLAFDPDVALFVNVGEAAARSFRSVTVGTVPTVCVVDVGVEAHRSSKRRIADAFSAHTTVRERVDDPDDLGQLGITISQLLSEHADEGERVLVCVNSLTALLEHNDLEDMFYFLHLLGGLLDTLDGVGYYWLARDAHGNETEGPLRELVDGVVTDEEGSGAVEYLVQPRSRTRFGRLEDRLVALTPWLWGLAILTYGLTDIFTTYLGLATGVAVEASPVASAVFGDDQFAFIYLAKFSIFGLFYLLWRETPRPYNVGIPLGLGILGAFITIWNGFVILDGL